MRAKRRSGEKEHEEVCQKSDRQKSSQWEAGCQFESRFGMKSVAEQVERKAAREKRALRMDKFKMQ